MWDITIQRKIQGKITAIAVDIFPGQKNNHDVPGLGTINVLVLDNNIKMVNTFDECQYLVGESMEGKDGFHRQKRKVFIFSCSPKPIPNLSSNCHFASKASQAKFRGQNHQGEKKSIPNHGYLYWIILSVIGY